jgi:hypothetical protein
MGVYCETVIDRDDRNIDGIAEIIIGEKSQTENWLVCGFTNSLYGGASG